MRTTMISCLALLTIGCGIALPAPKVDLIELRLSGWSAMDVSVNSDGKGQYHFSHPLPNGQSGSFSLEPEQFADLIQRLEPFQRQAVPLTDKSAQEFISKTCPQGLPSVTDAGAVWVHWKGRGINQHYLADLGCDAERNAARNKELINILKSLPVP